MVGHPHSKAVHPSRSVRCPVAQQQRTPLPAPRDPSRTQEYVPGAEPALPLLSNRLLVTWVENSILMPHDSHHWRTVTAGVRTRCMGAEMSIFEQPLVDQCEDAILLPKNEFREGSLSR